MVKNNGVLYEDDVLQIGCKLESRANLARLGMFYGNKTANQLTDFLPIVTCPGSLAVQLQAQVGIFLKMRRNGNFSPLQFDRYDFFLNQK